MSILAIFLMSVLVLTSVAATTNAYATAGMGNCKDQENCIPQKDRVGNDDPDDDDADRDGPGGDDGDPNDDDTNEQNCWGKVTSSLTQNDDGHPGIGEHTSDPRPGDDDNETPREGVGNQNEGHPSDHADTVGGLADDVPDCVD